MIIANKRNYSGSGVSIALSDPKTYKGLFTAGPITVPKGKVSTAFTKTTDSTGSVTLPAGHGILSNSYVDLYWAAGHRATVAVGTVVGNVVPLISDGGHLAPIGNILPNSAIVVTVSKQLSIGNIAKLVGESSFTAWQFTGVSSVTKCYVTPLNDPDTVLAPILSLGGELIVLDIAGGDTNLLDGIEPVTDMISNFHGLRISNGSSTADALFNLIVSGNWLT